MKNISTALGQRRITDTDHQHTPPRTTFGSVMADDKNFPFLQFSVVRNYSKNTLTRNISQTRLRFSSNNTSNPSHISTADEIINQFSSIRPDRKHTHTHLVHDSSVYHPAMELAKRSDSLRNDTRRQNKYPRASISQ